MIISPLFIPKLAWQFVLVPIHFVNMKYWCCESVKQALWAKANPALTAQGL